MRNVFHSHHFSGALPKITGLNGSGNGISMPTKKPPRAASAIHSPSGMHGVPWWINGSGRQ